MNLLGIGRDRTAPRLLGPAHRYAHTMTCNCEGWTSGELLTNYRITMNRTHCSQVRIREVDPPAGGGNTMKNTIRMGLVGLVAGTGVLLAAVPAHAGTKTWNYTVTCTEGTVFTRGTATYDVTHAVWRGVTYYSKIFPSSSSTPRVTTWYTSYVFTNRAAISAPSSVTGTAYNCAD